MTTYTFDGPSKTITVGYDGAITEFTAADLYSRWKDWVVAGNAQYIPAFLESVGGNSLGGGVELSGYYFINNAQGWTITHSPYNYEIRVSGDLYPGDPSIPFIQTTPDPYSVTFIFQRSAASYVNTADLAIPPTVGEIADAVWDETLGDHVTAGSTGKRIKDLLPTLWGVR